MKSPEQWGTEEDVVLADPTLDAFDVLQHDFAHEDITTVKREMRVIRDEIDQITQSKQKLELAKDDPFVTPGGSPEVFKKAEEPLHEFQAKLKEADAVLRKRSLLYRLTHWKRSA